MKTEYQLRKSEIDEFFYFKAVGSASYKLHYFISCFAVPFFLLLTYQCFDHLHTALGKFILTSLSIVWLIKGCSWFWETKIHCYAESRKLSSPSLDKKFSFQFDLNAQNFLINQIEIHELFEFVCLQSCMVLNYQNQTFLIPWRIFKNDEIKRQFIRSCSIMKSKEFSYSHKEA